jgi:hypothetical protein
VVLLDAPRRSVTGPVFIWRFPVTPKLQKKKKKKRTSLLDSQDITEMNGSGSGAVERVLKAGLNRPVRRRRQLAQGFHCWTLSARVPLAQTSQQPDTTLASGWVDLLAQRVIAAIIAGHGHGQWVLASGSPPAERLKPPSSVCENRLDDVIDIQGPADRGAGRPAAELAAPHNLDADKVDFCATSHELKRRWRLREGCHCW